MELLPAHMILLLPEIANSGPPHFLEENNLILTCQNNLLLSSPTFFTF